MSKKTKIMHVRGGSDISNVKVDEETIERVEASEYLGSLIDNNGDCSKEIKRRQAVASEKLVEMDKL